MTETLRDNLPNPTYYQDLVAAHPNADPDIAHKTLDNALELYSGPNSMTRMSSERAQEVANMVKPEIDEIVATQERIDNPISGASWMELEDGNFGLVGLENVAALALHKKAAQADLEQNIAEAPRVIRQQYQDKSIVRSVFEEYETPSRQSPLGD